MIKLLCFVLLLFSNLFLFSQTRINSAPIKLEWKENQTEEITENKKINYFTFNGASHPSGKDFMPFFKYTTKNYNKGFEIQVIIEDAYFSAFKNQKEASIYFANFINETITPEVNYGISKNNEFSVISFIPVRKNQSTGLIEKLDSFELKLGNTTKFNYLAQKKSTASNFKSNSVLSEGKWFRIGISTRGVHVIDRNWLMTNQLLNEISDPRKIAIFGHNGKMLNKKNSIAKIDDLEQLNIQVIGENDGQFNENDKIVFYAEDAVTRRVTNKRFFHENHLYCDTAYYFINFNYNGFTSRISQATAVSGVNYQTDLFDDFQFIEQEQVNHLKSGRSFYGELFDVINNRNYSFNFPNISASKPVQIRTVFIARSPSTSSLTVNANGTVLTRDFLNTDISYYLARFAHVDTIDFELTTSDNLININLNYTKPGNGQGWLDFIEVNARRKIDLLSSQLIFQDFESVAPNRVSRFIIGSITKPNIWEITNFFQAKSIPVFSQGNQHFIDIGTSELKQFVAFHNNQLLRPIYHGSVNNQNLHASNQATLLIITHPSLKSAAEQLTSLHQNMGMTVNLSTTQEIYNEFSSGMRDASAIRQFIMMMTKKYPTNPPKYVCLLGDGSYNNKSNLSGNTNLIPSFQSKESLHPLISYASDDFYAMLDENEGDLMTSGQMMDIAIGRLPAKNLVEANQMVNKISVYLSQSAKNEWRKRLVFVADDGDNSLHVRDAERLVETINTRNKDFDIDKIYCPSYNILFTPGGQRYPEVNSAITSAVNRGALIVNYTGHGGETGWAHERILTIGDINSWKNINNLPLFFTATCEFSRWDDPARTSAGELVLLNPSGGGIGLLTTTRVVFAFPNFQLNNEFYKLLSENNQRSFTIGDLFLETKQKTDLLNNYDLNNRNFILLGDPALPLFSPDYVVNTTVLNSSGLRMSSLPIDTMKALEKVTISGKIEDKNGNLVTDFNGTLFASVFDKSLQLVTQINKTGDAAINFNVWRNLVYRGRVSIKNGQFSFNFIVPKDISIDYDYGRISYYAISDEKDAGGYFENFMVGGVNENAPVDNNGPQIQLFMNDETFVNGSQTNNNPLALGIIYDDSGINTTGSSVGHDLVLILNNDFKNSVVVNDYYENETDSYQKGRLKYPYSSLPNGRHTLKMRAWDVYNNFSEQSIEFVVANSAEIALNHVLNYPNPFTTRTEFRFEHNQPGQVLDVNINIYTVSGKIVKTIKRNVLTQGFNITPIEWDGLDEFGDKIGKGVYVYQIKVVTPDGKAAEKFEKLVVLR
jgi:hypothetical protein